MAVGLQKAEPKSLIVNRVGKKDYIKWLDTYYYWSSTEAPGIDWGAYCIDYTIRPYGGDKRGPCCVRAILAF